MAISTVDPELREEVYPKDEFVDRQYVKSTSSDEQYEQEPWKHCQDPIIAYLSLRVQDRERFKNNLGKEQQDRITRDLGKIEQIRERFSMYKKNKCLIEKLENTKKEWKEEVARNVRNFLRDLESDQRTVQDWRRDADVPEVLRDDLEKLCASRLESKYQRHSMLIRRLASWGTDGSRPNDASKPPSTNRRGSFFWGKKPGLDQPTQSQPTPAIPENPQPNSAAGDVGPDPMSGFKAYAMYFKKASDKGTWIGKTCKNQNIPGEFPNQKIPMDKILTGEHENPLMQKCPRDTIRYFHFPTNNMSWIETAIARYYNEEPQAINDRKPYDPTAGKTQKLLAREFWRGQMHGTGSASADPVQGDQSSNSDSPSSPTTGSFPGNDKNIALFLPYLHWETSSRRAKMVQVINEVMGHEVKPPRLSNVVEETKKKHSKNRGNLKQELPLKYKTLLGTYLMTVAKVADEMDFEADERLLREYVKADAPLHIRRTLDQYYFVTLDDTSQRDKDQVVYRGTKAGHSLPSDTTRVVMVDQLWLWILDDTLIIIDQCSRVFFDRTKPLDKRPEVMDLFASAIGNVTEMTSIAYGSFWERTALHASNMLPNSPSKPGNQYLNINPEGVLFKEAQDITEELKIMKRIYTEQLNVVKDFKRHLFHPTGKDTPQGETAMLKKLLLDVAKNQTASKDRTDSFNDEETRSQSEALEATLHEAEGTLELIESRQAEIQDLEDSALRTCQQLQDLLSLKQQQASIVEAKAALQRADESVKQGRAIMAFTIVTIFFLPLGFFAAFFGMNNAETSDATWMSLNEQIAYMFGLSAVVIAISISIAFSPWIRTIIRVVLRVPYHVLDEYTQLRDKWARSPLNHVTLEQKTNRWLQGRKNRRQAQKKEEKENEDAEDGPKVAGPARPRSDPDKAGSAAWWRRRGKAQGGLV
ncbi:hypothetical protein DL766_003197 [Monosporascus sp. MC13-8B]|uniref:Ankyrin repeat protein n=1 Tax=Monosporascus cannonballus TaxID=155416 RepID=A0ABY0HIV2_9PEZI|nr:hypothetical protein DL762_002062 [Monosporascus cannonballus]RYO92171.1 hypothetical protein DL763_004786 [Monosporascus cannonballus]RYP34011.1 hypothetical protein DL766_003197 [Monosporascus sp. MC13-8B]